MTTTSPAKILIVGGGTSGTTLLRALRYLGFAHTELFERNSTLHPNFAATKGLVFNVSTTDALNRLDRKLYQSLVKCGGLVTYRGFRNDKGEAVDTALPRNSGVFRPFLAVPRSQYIELSLSTPLPDLTSEVDSVAQGGPMRPTIGRVVSGFWRGETGDTSGMLGVGWRPDPSVSGSPGHSEFHLVIGADGLAGPCGAFARNDTATGIAHARKVPHGAVLLEGWVPVSATGSPEALSAPAFDISNDDAPALAERGFRFTAAVVGSGPAGSEDGAHVHWRLLVPADAVKELAHLRPLVGAGQPLHSNPTVAFSDPPSISLANAPNAPPPRLPPAAPVSPAPADLLAAVQRALPFRGHTLPARLMDATPAQLVRAEVAVEVPWTAHRPHADLLALVGSAAHLPCPDGWLADSSRVDDALALALTLRQHIATDVSADAVSYALKAYATARSRRATEMHGIAAAQSDTLGDTSRIWSAISRFSLRYTPPVISTDEYRRAHHYKLLDDFPVTGLFLSPN